jgi:hypothetical protein
MLGGLFNTLAAPLLFSSIAEYPLVLALACLFVPARRAAATSGRENVRDMVVPLGIGAVTAALILVASAWGADNGLLVAAVGLPALLAFGQRRRPMRFALSIGAILLAGLSIGRMGDRILHAERTFFGVYRVVLREGRHHVLAHGTTLHGMQALAGPEMGEPLTYFSRASPFGQAFAALRTAHVGNIAVTGLGIGTLAAYAQPAQRWTFYEIDPALETIARNPAYFTYLERCGNRCRVVVGDARLELARASREQYDLLVLDAFSSDSIPIHLLTREALGLYLTRLAPGGVIIINITNSYVSLAPMVGNLAAAHNLIAVEQFDRPTANWSPTRFVSHWIVMARRREDLGSLMADPRWKPLVASTAGPTWTDDFSNIVGVLKRR